MCELLWSDPQEEKGRAPSKRGVGVSFGPDVTKSFLKANNLQLLVRSHEVNHFDHPAISYSYQQYYAARREAVIHWVSTAGIVIGCQFELHCLNPLESFQKQVTDHDNGGFPL